MCKDLQEESYLQSLFVHVFGLSCVEDLSSLLSLEAVKLYERTLYIVFLYLQVRICQRPLSLQGRIHSAIQMWWRNIRKQALHEEFLKNLVLSLQCHKLQAASFKAVYFSCHFFIYSGISTSDIDHLLMMSSAFFQHSPLAILQVLDSVFPQYLTRFSSMDSEREGSPVTGIYV